MSEKGLVEGLLEGLGVVVEGLGVEGLGLLEEGLGVMEGLEVVVEGLGVAVEGLEVVMWLRVVNRLEVVGRDRGSTCMVPWGAAMPLCDT